MKLFGTLLLGLFLFSCSQEAKKETTTSNDLQAENDNNEDTIVSDTLLASNIDSLTIDSALVSMDSIDTNRPPRPDMSELTVAPPMEEETAVAEIEEVEEIITDSPKPPAPPKPEVPAGAKQNASFPGGNSGLSLYTLKNLNYPARAKQIGLEGKVYVKFTVNPDGSLSNIRVIKGADTLLDEAAVQFIQDMPKWEPAMQDGVKIKDDVTLPVDYKL